MITSTSPRHALLSLLLVPTAVVCVALAPGDTVAVIGASGNVGKLVALRLADTYKVRGVVRDAEKVRPFLSAGYASVSTPGRTAVELFETDLRGARADEELQAALQGANGLVICTGTTAFPTKAWSQSEEADVTGAVLQALVESSFDVRAAIATLDAKGLNTPRNVDALGTLALLEAWGRSGAERKHCVLMSSIGVQRRTQMPFPILNACGVLDAKADGEAALKTEAQKAGFSYTIVRPGQLFGGPYDNNYYLGTLFQLDKDATTQDVEMQDGDTLVGDTLRSTLAEVIAQTLETGNALDADFSVVNRKGTPPTVESLRGQLSVL